MNTPPPISALRVDELLARIGSRAASPGAGAAAAVALALAAACASKAVNLSLKHRPDDRELQAALDTFKRVVAMALLDADRDSAAFEAFIHGKDHGVVDDLISEAERLKQLIETFVASIEHVAERVQPNLIGDLVAARALAAAAAQIEGRNEGEALQLR